MMTTQYSDATARMTLLENRIDELEVSSGKKHDLTDNSSSSGSLHDYQVQLHQRLVNIRNSLASEGGDTSQIREERDLYFAENVQLKKEAERLNYRVQHLIKALDAAEKAT
jgi:hypothetical protein